MKYKKGQHVVCKYHGSDNGDLIVGRVDSVRKDGEILLVNLLLNKGAKKAQKKSSVLAGRNQIVPKIAIRELLLHWNRFGDKAAVRKMAVAISDRHRPSAISEQLRLPIASKQLRRPAVKKRTERFELLLDTDEVKLLQDLARKEGLTCADVVRQLIRRKAL